MPAEPAGIEVRNLARRFGKRWVLRGIDLAAGPGEAVAIMGRNGSGKTTLLRVLSTLLRPSRGGGTVFGWPLVDGAEQIRELVGILGHHAGLYEDLTAEENLRFSLGMAGLAWTRTLTDRVLAEVGLADARNERVRGFSAGMRRRLAVGRLLLRRPKLLLLDEPYAAFDDAGIALVNGLAEAVVRDGGIVLIATHDLSRARGVVRRVVRIESGRALESDPVSGDSALDQVMARTTG